jgi:hypothetical protein
MIWRERRVPLIVMAVLLAGNIFFFFTYRVQYTSRLNDLDNRLETAQKQLADAQRARTGAEQQLAAYAKIRHDLDVLYNERWSTQAQRFTELFAEVKKLATVSRFDPRSYSFSRTEQASSKDPGSEGNTTVGMSFTVQGSYEQVRQLINLLELSNQFVIIDGIGLNASGGDPKNLTLSIHLKTMFREPIAANAQRANKQL